MTTYTVNLTTLSTEVVDEMGVVSPGIQQMLDDLKDLKEGVLQIRRRTS